MRRFLLVFYFTLLSSLLFSQGFDTLIYKKKVDSLELSWNDLLAKGKYKEILVEVNSSIINFSNAIGQKNEQYAFLVNYRGVVHFYLQQFKDCEKDYLEAMDIWKQIMGVESSSYATGLNNLGYLYFRMEDFEKAENYYKQALDIRIRIEGKWTANYAWIINNLGILYYLTGRFEECQEAYEEARKIREKVFGKFHKLYAGSLNNLATLYMELGQYEAAEPLYIEALEIKEKTAGKDNIDYISNLENLAILYGNLGNLKKERKLYLQVKAIKEKLLTKDDPAYASILTNLASNSKNLGNYEEAEKLFLEAKVIKQKAFGSESSDYAYCLFNLASLYISTKQFNKGEPIILEAKGIIEKTFGKEHEDYAKCNIILSGYRIMRKDFVQAEQLLLEARDIQEKLFGKEHIHTREVLIRLARLYETMGHYEKAEELLIASFQIQKQSLNKAASFLSERELQDYINTFKIDNAWVSTFLAERSREGKDVSKLAALCYDNELYHKGFLLNTAQKLNNTLLIDKASVQLRNTLKSIRRRLGQLYSMSITERDSAQLVDWENKANQIEKQLASTVNIYKDASQTVGWKDVQAKLKDGELSIEFIEYNQSKEEEVDSVYYGALVVGTESTYPEFVPLFQQNQILSLMGSGEKRKLDYINQLYTYSGRGANPLKENEVSLSQLIWLPLKDKIKEAKKIYYSPIGLIHYLNLGAIAISDEEVLANQYQLVELGSTRKLVISDTTVRHFISAVLYGGIDYGTDTTTLIPNKREDVQTFAMRGTSWGFLKWTTKEINSVNTYMLNSKLSSTLFTGIDATEKSFVNSVQSDSSPYVIHFATHGYFFQDANVQVAFNSEDETKSDPVFVVSDNPMIRSGLLFAGANISWNSRHNLRQAEDDGILTAYEISQLNLSNTELVVLSACETGLGDIQGNEGVYGLQRAFKIAGARYLIMSLWQVPDKQTSLLMTTFYKKWLQEKMTIPDAFHAAQKELREIGLDPYQWAGFILVE